jgi:hypothetical protein
MRNRWVQILALLILTLGIVTVLPVAAQSSCTISTSGTVRMRAGHSINDAILGNLPRNTQFQVVERFVESLARNRTRVWYRLVKEEVAPTATAEQVWVGGTVKTKGDCANAASTGSTASTGSAGSPATSLIGVLPQSGNWGLTYGDNVNVSCGVAGVADFSTSGEFTQLGTSVAITSAANGFAFKGVNYTQDINGTWHGSYAVPEAQATGDAYIRVDTPTSILGDIVVTLADFPGCTFKIPFWANPR